MARRKQREESMRMQDSTSTASVNATPEQVTIERPRCWEAFFMCQKNPIWRSQLITSMMAGTQLHAESVPNALLLDLLLFATASRYYLQAEIVDDYEALKQRVREEWAKPDWTTKVFSQTHARWCNCILNGATQFDCPEEKYIPDMVSWYIEHNPPVYFVEEFKEQLGAAA